MSNKYDLLDQYELNQFLYNVLNLNEKARYSFIQDLLETVSPNKWDKIVVALFDNDIFNDVYNLEQDLYLNFFQKLFDQSSTRYIYNQLSECHESFLMLLSNSEKLLTQYFNAILVEDKKNYPVFNSLMTDIIDNTDLMSLGNFKKVVFSLQDKFQPSVLKDIVLCSSEAIKNYNELNASSKEKLRNSSDINAVLNYVIQQSKKKDNLKLVLQENNLIDKLNASQIIFCIENNKKTLINQLFTKQEINEQLQLDFWNIVLINADNKNNWFGFLKQNLSKQEIAQALKRVIKTEASFAGFYRNQIDSKKLPIQAMLNIIEAFEGELKTYLKINPIKLLDKFLISNETRIKKDMFKHFYSNDKVNETYDNLVVDIQKKTLDRMVEHSEEQKPVKKLKI